MTDARPCPTCRSEIPAGSPGGACPRCLMALAFATDAGAAPPQDVAPEEVARRFPGYEVVAPLGRGGMGVVFRARQKALDREVALKVLPGGPLRPPGFTERFEREAKALARLQHPGIVQVFDFGTSPDGWCFLAMELVDGANLRALLADHRLAAKEALAIVPQICDALQYAHDRGVVHRDIKPENVLVSKDGHVKIADFGLAKLVAEARNEAPMLTHTGISMGTPVYMAPEQIERPSEVDHRADIYSLGVVFYEMLTGELPLGRFAPPSSKSSVDSRIDDIVLRTLEKERAARFQQASDVKTRIGEAAASPPPLPVEVPTPAPFPDPRRRMGGLLPPKPEPKAPIGPPPKASKFAIAMAIGAPLAVALVALGVWEANAGTEWERRITVASIWTFGALFVGIVLGFVAWGRVRHSGGTMYGRRFALIAVLGSLVAWGVAAPFVAFEYEMNERARRATMPQIVYGSAGSVLIEDRRTTVRPVGQPPRDARYVDGVEVPVDAPADQIGVLAHGPKVRALFDRALKAWPSERSDITQSVYEYGDSMLITGLEAPVRAERRAAGTLGLPLASREFLGADLQTFRIEKIDIEAGRMAGTIDVTDGRSRFRARVERGLIAYSPQGPVWYFALAPVERLTAGAAPAPVDPALAVIESELAKARQHLNELTIAKRYTAEHPELQAALATIDQLERRRKDLLSASPSPVQPPPVPDETK